MERWIEWREVDELSTGHGVEIEWQADDGETMTLAFIVGYEWTHGPTRTEVQILRGAAKEWARVSGEPAALHGELIAIVHEVLGGAPLTLERGRLRVWANA